MPATLNWPRQSIGGGCQSSEMAALLNSLSFAFTNSKYHVKYYDYYCKVVHWDILQLMGIDGYFLNVSFKSRDISTGTSGHLSSVNTWLVPHKRFLFADLWADFGMVNLKS